VTRTRTNSTIRSVGSLGGRGIEANLRRRARGLQEDGLIM
jgi:hypothetical protein